MSLFYKTDDIKIYNEDNLDVMNIISNETIDLIYSDILYGTGKKFKDYADLKPQKEMIDEHYVPRIIEMHRLLKHSGSIYLQMDYRISHWIRCIMDDIFGYENFVNEIVWTYGLGNNNKKRNWQDKHDTILYYSKTKDYTWNNMRGEVTKQMKSKYCHTDNLGEYMMSYGKKYYLKGGKRMSNSWDIPNLSATDNERTGYSTQKPKSLIERILKASSKKGDLIGDFYMGSGTTLDVYHDMGRMFVGCDINLRGCEIAVKRLNKFT